MLDLFSLTSIPLAIGAGVLFYGLLNFIRNQWQIVKQINQIPGPRIPSLLLGHLSIFWQAPKNGDWYQQIFNTFVGVIKVYQEQKEGFIRFWIGPTQPIVVVFDAECAENLLTSNVNIDKSKEYDFAIPWLGLGLFTSTGTKWRTHRKLLTPAFHFRILESFIPIINKQQRIMKDLIEAKMDSRQVVEDIKPLITNCALDIICETAMGVKISAQTDPNSSYPKAVRKVLDLFTLRFLSPWQWNNLLFQLTPSGFEQRRLIRFLHKFTTTVIKRKREKMISETNPIAEEPVDGNKKVLAFLDILLTQESEFSDEDIRSEVDTFMSAGQDTSSATIQFALQLIGNHPEVQEKIHDELDGIFAEDSERDIGFEDLRQMKYLEQCIKETLRLYPPVLFIARNIKEKFQIKSATIPAGTTCLVLFYQLHRDPKYFPNPEKFDPDRFSAQNSNRRHAFAYTPFSAGPRNCIGQRFALQTTKALLASILRRYRVTSLIPMDRVELAIGSTMGPKNKIPLKLECRI